MPIFALLMLAAGGYWLVSRSMRASSASSSDPEQAPSTARTPAAVPIVPRTSATPRATQGSQERGGARRSWSWDDQGKSGTSASDAEDDYIQKTSTPDTADYRDEYARGYGEGYHDYPGYSLNNGYVTTSFAYDQGYDAGWAQAQADGVSTENG